MARVEDIGYQQQLQQGYWNARKQYIYYQAVSHFVAIAGYDAESIIDIGSAGTDYVCWFPWIADKVMLDFKVKLPTQVGVRKIETNFLEWTPDKVYDVALCMQVLEHIPDPRLFCEKLKQVCRKLIVSVPYKWRAGGTPGHIHDPVDEIKLRDWMGLIPNNSQTVTEPFRESRLIAFYDLENGPQARFPRERIVLAVQERLPAVE